jgi:hypothetical protein
MYTCTHTHTHTHQHTHIDPYQKKISHIADKEWSSSNKSFWKYIPSMEQCFSLNCAPPPIHTWKTSSPMRLSLETEFSGKARAGGVAQVIECLPCTHEALNSNTSTKQKN